MKAITVSAAGKLMLLGEHAVIYGYSCIAAAVDKYLSVVIREADSLNDKIVTPDIFDQNFVKSAIRVFREEYLLTKRISLTTKMELGKFGLGSSAAVTVATVKALAVFYQIDLSTNELFDLSYQVVSEIQDQASGFDIAASIFGGTIYFNGRTKKSESLSLAKLPLVVGFSGIKSSTKEMINKVYRLKKEKPVLVDEIFKNMAQLVEEGWKAVTKTNWVRLGQIMDENQILLTKLQVTTPKIEKLIIAAKAAGAYGAKLSGAGGGDCIIAAVSETKKEKVENAIRQTGGIVIDIGVGNGSGIKVI